MIREIVFAVFCAKRKDSSALPRNLCSTAAPLRGFEPPTYRLGGGRSIQLSYNGVYQAHSYIIHGFRGFVKGVFCGGG